MKQENELLVLEDRSMIRLHCKGNYDKTEKFLKDNKDFDKIKSILEKYGREGVAALSSATPIDSGETASSWNYEIIDEGGAVSLTFVNSSCIETGTPIAILLQYGHGNGRGGYVQGRDFINPAIQPVFDKLLEEAWREVSK